MDKVYSSSGESFFMKSQEELAFTLLSRDYKDPPVVFTSCKARHFTEATEDIAYTLVGTDYKEPPMVAEPIVLESNQNHATITQEGVTPTLPASMGMGGGYVPMITEVEDEEEQ